ncbi:JAB domain-containing protein [Peptostreptococcus anaerobius]
MLYKTRQARTEKGVFVELVREEAVVYPDTKVSNPEDIHELMKVLGVVQSDVEQLWAVCLNAKNKVVGVFLVSQGTTNCTIVIPKDIFKRALLVNANSVIITHNHPSGVVTPSKEDKDVTERCYDAGKIIGIELLDHIVVSEDDYYSFKKESDI